MRELSDKEIEQLYKEEIMTEIPDLWKNIEGNLAPKCPKADADGRKDGRSRKKTAAFYWMTPAAAMLAVVVLAVPAWQLMKGGSKSYDGASEAMENNGDGSGMSGSYDSDAFLTPEESRGPGDTMPEESGETGDPAPGDNGGSGDMAPGGTQAEEGQMPGSQEGSAAGSQEREFRVQVELQAEQVQTTLEGYLVTGEVLASEENWFEAGEKVTLFYEGDAYGEEDFSGRISVLLDVEEENLKILEILP